VADMISAINAFRSKLLLIIILLGNVPRNSASKLYIGRLEHSNNEYAK
jgi:hypothetical protein